MCLPGLSPDPDSSQESGLKTETRSVPKYCVRDLELCFVSTVSSCSPTTLSTSAATVGSPRKDLPNVRHHLHHLFEGPIFDDLAAV